MGLADQKQKRQTGDYIHSEPGFAVNGWQHSATWRGRVGARLLSQIPKASSRLHQSVVERGELECGGAALRKIARGKVCRSRDASRRFRELWTRRSASLH